MEAKITEDDSDAPAPSAAGPRLGAFSDKLRCEGFNEERRAINRAFRHWQERYDRCGGVPQLSDLDFQADPSLTSYLFLLDILDGARNPRMVYGGDSFLGAFGVNPAGRPVMEGLPRGFAEKLADFCHSAAQYRQALVDSDRYLHHGADLLYRTIVMPLRDAQGRISHIFGAFNYCVAVGHGSFG